jgi:hypothetical protein
MTMINLSDLQASVQDLHAFNDLTDYRHLCAAFLDFLQESSPTLIYSPTDSHYIFYQYDADYGRKITRPLNSSLFLRDSTTFLQEFEQFLIFLDDLRKYQEQAKERTSIVRYLDAGSINRIIYTIQQSIGCIGDAFGNSNQARKRIGQLFENLIRLTIKQTGIECEPRTLMISIPEYPGHKIQFQLDIVFSRGKVILSSATEYLHHSEVTGSVKTTSKDRLDKIFLDKYMLSRLLQREIPCIAIFLHDVQRAKRTTPDGESIFGVNSTFKTNHFLGYTLTLNALDGVYYVDPRPVMNTDERLAQYIKDFQCFLATDLWTLTERNPI